MSKTKGSRKGFRGLIVRPFVAQIVLATAGFFLALPAAAQNATVVTGTITDSNGLAYSNATVQAQLVPSGVTPTIPPPCNGQNSTPCAVSAFQRATADVTGTFSMNLASNAVLTPGGTQWQFTINETGVPPPLGTGSQTCSATLTISGASQSVSASFAACPALSNILSAGSALTKVASGTATLNTNLITSGTCDTVVTVAATGALTTDNVLADFNANPTGTTGYLAGAMLTIVKYPTAGNVNFIVCNNTAINITPGAITLNWRVVR